ncbi:hypothetical protein SAMN06273570_5071 [Candidatus Pantoea floridensis]|uniref:Uncharacterized protein n=1 Tax=Candidatus Pantoea floridensis TaxID=1938870 RepID=A0A286DRL0_9GAMM|nr:hypothetical protein BX596_4973 [Enterobacteriaceae bacterium JKS000233]SOD61296.1 hypothetical protein SAMN06273570_5071 [Pantoea floridensis]
MQQHDDLPTAQTVKYFRSDYCERQPALYSLRPLLGDIFVRTWL